MGCAHTNRALQVGFASVTLVSGLGDFAVSGHVDHNGTSLTNGELGRDLIVGDDFVVEPERFDKVDVARRGQANGFAGRIKRLDTERKSVPSFGASRSDQNSFGGRSEVFFLSQVIGEQETRRPESTEEHRVIFKMVGNRKRVGFRVGEPGVGQVYKSVFREIRAREHDPRRVDRSGGAQQVSGEGEVSPESLPLFHFRMFRNDDRSETPDIHFSVFLVVGREKVEVPERFPRCYVK